MIEGAGGRGGDWDPARTQGGPRWIGTQYRILWFIGCCGTGCCARTHWTHFSQQKPFYEAPGAIFTNDFY